MNDDFPKEDIYSIWRIDYSKVKPEWVWREGKPYNATGEELVIPKRELPLEDYKKQVEEYEKLHPTEKLNEITEEESVRRDFKISFTADKKTAIHGIAKYLIKKHYIKTIGGKREREIFIYQEGVYISGENTLKKEIQELLEELCATHYIKEIIDTVKNLSITDRKNFSVDRNFINLNNGVLDIATGELKKHDPENLFFNKIPVDYVLGADCPKIKKFLLEILDENDIPIIQEWFGYALYRSYFIKKAIIFVGEGNTGKTTLLKVADKFIGSSNISGVSLQKLSHDKFSAAHFYGKHMNIYDDLDFRDINDNGAFKIATGGGSITGEYKFGDQFQFENYAKLTFACNKIPDIKDTNDIAYFNRWIIIHFRKEITVMDKFLIDKITTSEELSGLLNFVLEGLVRLLEKQEFSYSKTPHEIRAEMQLSGSVIAQFKRDCLMEATGEWISKTNMHNAFIKYARSKKLPIDTLENFGKKIRDYANYIIDSKSLELNPLTGNKIQATGWRNVELKEIDIENTQPEDNSVDTLNDEYQQEPEQKALSPEIS